MSPARALWVFRRVALVSLAVYTGYVCEGFEVGQGSLVCIFGERRSANICAAQLKAGNSIIANVGFIEQFGKKGDSGVAALNSTCSVKCSVEEYY